MKSLNKIIKIIFFLYFRIVSRDPLLTKSVLQRLSNGYYKTMLLNWYEYSLEKKSSYIGYSAVFSNNPCFPHGISGIFISIDATIGKNCVIFQQVTIGSNNIPGSPTQGAPVIGDNCYIGAGAKIIGGINIGNNCRIGANCVVYQDMPDNSLAVMQPTRIIKRDELMDNRFFRKNNSCWEYYCDEQWHSSDCDVIL